MEPFDPQRFRITFDGLERALRRRLSELGADRCRCGHHASQHKTRPMRDGRLCEGGDFCCCERFCRRHLQVVK